MYPRIVSTRTALVNDFLFFYFICVLFRLSLEKDNKE